LSTRSPARPGSARGFSAWFSTEETGLGGQAERGRQMVRQDRIRHQIWAARPFNVFRLDRPGLEPSMLLVRVKGLEPPRPYPRQRPEWVIFYRTRTSKSHLRKTAVGTLSVLPEATVAAFEKIYLHIREKEEQIRDAATKEANDFVAQAAAETAERAKDQQQSTVDGETAPTARSDGTAEQSGNGKAS
jgi:hypothetical protein